MNKSTAAKETVVVVTKPEDVVPPAVMTKASEVLSAGRLVAARAAPYFRAALLSLVQRPVPGLGTVATTDTAIFLYDPFVVAKWTPKQMAGAFVHECCHIWQKHIKRRGDRDAYGWNVAADRSINPSIFEIGLELPPGPAMPKDIGMSDGLTADEYYRKQDELGQNGGGDEGDEDGDGEQEGSGSGQGDQDGNGKPGKGKGKSKGSFGHGACGSCAGNQHSKEPPKDDAEGRSAQTMERVAKNVSEAIKDAAQTRSQGRLPAGWVREAELSLEPPKIPWQQKLANITRAVVTYRPGGVVHRFDGPSKKQGGLGYGAGRPILPRMRSPNPNVSVLIDTSGSMGGETLTDVLREVRGVLKACDAVIDVCVCDAAVHGLQKVKDINSVARMLKGGGGSDFNPAFEQLMQLRPKPDVIIALTDGYISVPPEPPPGVRVIWVLVGGNEHPPAQWGEPIVCKD